MRVAAGIVVLALGVERASAAAPSRPLLRVESRTTSNYFLSGMDSDQWIFTDGLVIRTERGFEHPSGATTACALERFTASAASMAELKEALKANHVGVLQGNCTVATGADLFDAADDVTWFGRGARRNSYRIVWVVGAYTCGGEAAIAAAVTRLRSEAEFSRTVIVCPDLDSP